MFHRNRTETLCYEAVIDEGFAFKYVENQTPRIIDLECFEHSTLLTREKNYASNYASNYD